MRLAIDFTAQEKLGLDDFTLDAFSDPFGKGEDMPTQCYACEDGRTRLGGDCGTCFDTGELA